MRDEARLVRELPINEAIELILGALLESARDAGLANSYEDLKITAVYPEGPAIVIYTRRRDLVGNDEVAKGAAKRVRKRMEIRADESIRLPEDEAAEVIKNLVGDIIDAIFDEARAIVYIITKDPGAVIGPGGEIRRRIIAETGRIPRVLKVPDVRPGVRTFSFLYRIIAQSTVIAKDDLIAIGFRIHRPRIYHEKNLRITFLGGAGEVGRSSMLIQTPNSNILVDFGLGLHQGRIFPRIDLGGVPLEEIDAVIVTHAHMDHSGLVPLLYKFGYKGPVYMTSATRDLVYLLRHDYINLAKRLGTKPLYSREDIDAALQHTITIDYNLRREDMRSDVTDIAPDVRLTLYNAGHILGSAIVHLHVGDGMHNIVIAQDFRYTDAHALLEPAATRFPRVETLIMETTYGGGREDDPNRARDVARLIREIRETLESGGRVLIPVLSVGRAQEVLMHIYFAMRRRRLPEVPVFVDGMAVSATALYTAHTDMLSNSVRRILRRENFFVNESFVYLDPEKRGEALEYRKPSIVLAPNGMLNGGPAIDYLERIAPDEKNKIILVSYQAPGTPGRELLNRRERISIGDKELAIKAKVVPPIRGLTSHSTYSELIRYVDEVKRNNPNLRDVILVHGERKKIRHMSRVISEKFGLNVFAPLVGHSYSPR